MNIDKAIRLTRKYKAEKATEQDRQKALDKAHDYICLGYTLMNAADIIMRETANVMSAVGPERRYEDTFHICDSMKDIQKVIRRTDIYSQHFDGLISEENPMAYDAMRNNAYEVLRFVMLLYSRTCGNAKSTKQLEAYMRHMKNNGLFSDDEISSFKMKI